MNCFKAALASLSLLPLVASADFPGAYNAVDFESALRLARDDKKPVMVFYTLPFCAPCSIQKGFLDTQRARSALIDRYHFADVNTRSVPKVLKHDMQKLSNYGIGRGAPQIAIVDYEGRLICSVRGGFNNAEHAVAIHQWITKRDWVPARLEDYPFVCGTA